MKCMCLTVVFVLTMKIVNYMHSGMAVPKNGTLLNCEIWISDCRYLDGRHVTSFRHNVPALPTSAILLRSKIFSLAILPLLCLLFFRKAKQMKNVSEPRTTNKFITLSPFKFRPVTYRLKKVNIEDVSEELRVGKFIYEYHISCD